jgi:diguanylate cyclase (GGDEF)-like protein
MPTRLWTGPLAALLGAPAGVLGVATFLSWSPDEAGRTLTATLAALGGASAVSALVFALDAARVRRAFAHLRRGGGALPLPTASARIGRRDAQQHEALGHLRRQVEQLSAIRDLCLIVNDDVSLERILERALAVLGGLMDAQEISVFLSERQGDDEHLVPIAHRTGEKTVVRVTNGEPLEVAPDVALRALDARRTVVEPGRGGLRAATLLVAEGEVMGALEVRLAEPGDELDLRELERTLEGLAKPIALAIRKPALYDRAVVDGLTGLYTKRHFLEQVTHHMAARTRLGTPLSMLVIDVDHFKKVNDTHGHVAGDAVLAEVARRVRAAIRGYDLAFRYGGEEVVILCPNTILDDAVGLAERLRRTIADTPVQAGAVSIPITASLGVAELDPDLMEEPGAFVEAADKHLYVAKRNGRNQVRSDLSPPIVVAAPVEAPAPAAAPAPASGDSIPTPTTATGAFKRQRTTRAARSTRAPRPTRSVKAARAEVPAEPAASASDAPAPSSTATPSAAEAPVPGPAGLASEAQEPVRVRTRRKRARVLETTAPTEPAPSDPAAAVEASNRAIADAVAAA